MNFQNQLFYYVKIRGGVSSAVYNKLITVSKAKLSVYNSGQIINFMSTGKILEISQKDRRQEVFK